MWSEWLEAVLIKDEQLQTVHVRRRGRHYELGRRGVYAVGGRNQSSASKISCREDALSRARVSCELPAAEICLVSRE